MTVRPARRWLAVAGVALLLAWLGLSALAVQHLTSRARPPFPEPPPAGFASLRLLTADGEAVGAWHLPGRPERATVLLLHGNGGRRGDWLPLAGALTRAGVGVLLLTFRAHGDSTGDLNDLGYGGRWEVLAAVDFLERRHPGRPVVVLGFSLGAAAALFAAEQLGGRVAAYILESPYPDLATALNNRLRLVLPWPLDRIAAWGMLAAAPVFLPHWRRISPERAIGDVPGGVPILFLAGAADRRATPADVARLARRVPERSRWEVLFPEAAHGEAYRRDPDRYRDAVLAWVQRAEAGR